ncbi:MAG TPA: hypothetical protein VFW07_13060 [Parafilimonas sp.]|nr:hypothetical protein [Parafilimonas sp.]
MKKILKPFPILSFAILSASVLLLCSWQNPNENNYSGKGGININQRDTTPKYDYKIGEIDMQAFDKAMKSLDKNMADLNLHMKDLDLNFGKQLESLSKINFDEIQKQTEASIKSIDWDKMQKDVDVSLQNMQAQIAKIDFSKMQNEMKDLQEKFQSDEFKSQFNSEKMQRQIDDAMSKAKEGIEKAKEKMQQMKDFTDELAADGLIDKKKGYTIEWKNGNLYINDKEQPKNISDKYRKYESTGKVNMLPEGVEHF